MESLPVRTDCAASWTDNTLHQPDAEPLEASFELNDTLYAKANIPRSEEVYLWLGVRIPSPPLLHQPTLLPPPPTPPAQTLLSR